MCIRDRIKTVIEVERMTCVGTKKIVESLDQMMATQETLLEMIVRRIGWKTKFGSGNVK